MQLCTTHRKVWQSWQDLRRLEHVHNICRHYPQADLRLNSSSFSSSTLFSRYLNQDKIRCLPLMYCPPFFFFFFSFKFSTIKILKNCHPYIFAFHTCYKDILFLLFTCTQQYHKLASTLRLRIEAYTVHSSSSYLSVHEIVTA